MERLFTFNLVRPAVERNKDAPSIQLTQRSDFQDQLTRARGGGRQAMKAVARTYVASAGFALEVSRVLSDGVLERLAAALDVLETDGAADRARVVAVVEAALGGKIPVFMNSDNFKKTGAVLRDMLIAIKLLPEEHERPIEKLTGALRDLEVVARLATDENFPKDGADLRRYRRRSVQLPDLSLAVKPDRTPGVDGRDVDDKLRQAIKVRYSRFQELTKAVDELTKVSPSSLSQSPLRSSSKSMPAASLRPLALFEQSVKQGHPLVRAGAEAASDSTIREEVRAAASAAIAARSTPSTAVVHTVVTPASNRRTLFNGRPSLKALEPGATAFKLSDEGARNLSATTRKILEERGIRITSSPLDEAVTALQTEARRLHYELEGLTPVQTKTMLKRVGTQFALVDTVEMSPLLNGSMDGVLTAPSAPASPVDNRIPQTHGHVQPVGIMDLLVVKQQLKGYAAMDIAHIENVLKGEVKEREHRRRSETETITFLETETTRAEERELESTDRFEMTRESNATIKEDASLKAGLSVSGFYGPTVTFAASAEGSISRSKEEAVRTASSFSKEVTQRSASRISERVLTRSQVKTNLVVDELNKHGLHNESGEGHVRGIYQWVEKVYEAQMFNYGLRTLFDFMVPEPAAFLTEVYKRAHNHAMVLQKPTALTLRADQITEYNYHALVLAYSATDVTPPPEPYITKAIDFSAGGGDEKTDYNHSGQVSIDEGYQAVQATIGRVVNIWEDEWSVDLVVGRRSHRFEEGESWVHTTPLNNEVGAIAFGLNTFRVSDVAMAGEVKCARTDRAMAKWREETHSKLVTAYRARLSEYEEKLAALAAQAGIAIQGRSPPVNQVLIRNEIKKVCLTILTNQHFVLFDAIETGSNGLPQTDLYENEAEGPYVRFFEEAFEWEHMTWLTYPYFWGRKSQWPDRMAIEDTDPAFEDFLKSGYCRAVVPVRPGFEGAVDHFLTIGELWMGGPLPTISSPLYLPIADEIAERLDRPGDEFPEGDPWEVRIATNLVFLREQATLPSWTKQTDGTWTPQ
jgi:hypothetical protein